VVKTYELPPAKSKKEDSGETPVRQGLNRMGTWTGLSGKKDVHAESSKSPPAQGESSGTAVRQGLARMGTWGFGGKGKDDGAGRKPDEDDEDDDRRIRFTIGGAGRRLTKDDFLKEIQSLDPKARCEVIEQSDAPHSMKDLAKKDASNDSPGSGRLFNAKSAQVASGKGPANAVGAEMGPRQGAPTHEGDTDEEEDSEEERIRMKNAKGSLQLSKRKVSPKGDARKFAKVGSPSNDVGESPAERKRREQVLKGVDDDTPSPRGRPPRRGETEQESAAERRRREAALRVGGGAQDDSDDDDTPRIPPPVAKARGIRFAQSPVRGKK
jgi:hypothetical protein